MKNSTNSTAKIFLKGGIGNNLFQYAQGIYLSNRGYEVTYNTFLTRQNPGTKFLGWSIHRDDLRGLVFSGEMLEEALSPGDALFLTKEYLWSSLLRKRSVWDRANQAGSSSLRLVHCSVSGPYMNPEVFQRLRHKIIESIVEQDPRPSMERSLVVAHYRAGDLPVDKRIGWAYYRECIEQLGAETGRVQWITDDPAALRRLTAGDRLDHQIASSSSAAADFLAMFRASTIICSNSTFCYWAAVLGDAGLMFVPERTAIDNKYDLPIFSKSVRKVKCTFLAEAA